MKRFCAKVIVRLKPTVRDMLGENLKRAIDSYVKVENLVCRVGTCYNFKFDVESQVEALNLVKLVADELLTNEFAEEYEIRSIDEIIEII